MQDDKVPAIHFWIQIALPLGCGPGRDVRFQFDQIHGIGRAPPVEVLDHRVRPCFLGQVMGVRMVVIIEEVDHRRARYVNGRKQ